MQWQDLSSLQPLLPSSSDSCTSTTLVAGITGACHHAQLIFVFLVEMGFHHVGQVGLELLASSDLPALDSPKCWDYSCEPLCQASIMFIIFKVTISQITSNLHSINI